jgi:hypothetical protein
MFRPLVRVAMIAALAVGSVPAPSFAAPPPASAAQSAVPEALVSSLAQLAPGLRPEVLRLALKAAITAEQSGLVIKQNILTVIDY